MDINKKSKRAQEGKLTIEETYCPYCNHNKKFVGNHMGYNIKKCCRCKNEL
jgi:hypothetical protein